MILLLTRTEMLFIGFSVAWAGRSLHRLHDMVSMPYTVANMRVQDVRYSDAVLSEQ